MSALVLGVRLHDGRYYGEGDWPPSPARLFQALVAGAGLAGPIGNAEKEGLEWLENQAAPLVAAPLGWRSRRGVLVYMPNNDSDAIAGDPMRMPEIRTDTKTFRPRLFDATVPFVYAWPLVGGTADDGRARAICSLAERLYQLGRGIDMAWAWGEVLDDDALEDLLSKHPGRILHPSPGKGAVRLATPCVGSLGSLLERHQALGQRIRYEKAGKLLKGVFRKPPRPRFQQTSYDGPPSRQLYELRGPVAEGTFASWPLVGVPDLVVRLRDGAVERLNGGLPARQTEIERILVGRKADGTNDVRPESRVRIIPLPSVGHVHADHAIRRLLVEVPPGCSLRADDVHWAFSGLEVVDVETGEIHGVLTRSDGEDFQRHFGIGQTPGACVWRTMTPAVLPEPARRRIDPARRADEAKPGSERVEEHVRAAGAVCHALRHAGVRRRVESVRVQREPFNAHGARVEAFAAGTRFDKDRLWHVEIRFDEPVRGPLVIGDGRFLGLGVMAPVTDARELHAFDIVSGLCDRADAAEVARALRRAVMARAQQVLGSEPLPSFFSGHAKDGTPARSSDAPHLAYAFDPTTARVAIIAPHLLDRREAGRQEREHLATLERALEDFVELRAGRAGHLVVRRAAIDLDADALTRPARVWTSATPFVVTRHVRLGDAVAAIETNLRDECRRCDLPDPGKIDVWVESVPGRALAGRVTLRFKVAVRGPIALGRTRFAGGGLFLAGPEPGQN